VFHAWQANDPADTTPQMDKHSGAQVQLAGFYNRR
jgi:hypothetical protein